MQEQLIDSYHVLKGSASLLTFSHGLGQFGTSSSMACVHLKQERGRGARAANALWAPALL